jgi:hypothetical protein
MIDNGLWVTDPLLKSLASKLKLVMLIGFSFKLCNGVSIIKEEFSSSMPLHISINYKS